MPFYPAKGSGAICETWVINERARRITALVEKPRCMTVEAATIVIDAAMFSIGCIEGTVRAEIQARMDARGEDDHGIR